MSLVFPLPFDGDSAGIEILDANGNKLDDTLGENTYTSWGTIPRGSISPITIYVKNCGKDPIYSAKLEGVESSEQYGTALETYQALDTPQELGLFEGREIKAIQVYWSVPDDSVVGIKVFGIQATDSDEFDFVDDSEYWTKITITNNDTDLLQDFPIEINFDAASITWANTTSDGRDLRFYDENFKELKYYIESWNPPSETAKVFVRIPRLYGHETKHIYVGYGNLTLSSLSDVRGKYEVYEDFDGGFDEEWIVLNPAYSFIDTPGCIHFSSANGAQLPNIYLPINIGNSFVVEFSAKYGTKVSPSGTWSACSNIILADSPYKNMYYNAKKTNPLSLVRAYISYSGTYNNSYYLGNSSSSFSTTLRQFKLEYINKKVTSYYPPDTPVETTAKEISMPLYICIGAAGSQSSTFVQLWVDYIYIYKILPITPTITFEDVADITEEFTNPDVDSGVCACVGNVIQQLKIYDIDFRNIMYEVGDFNATWRLPGTEGITIWGIYQPRPVGDYFFPDMDNVGINDSLFFTVTDYLVDIHDKIDIEGVRFDLQAIQVHPIADQKIYKMCVLKRQPEYYATCKGSVS